MAQEMYPRLDLQTAGHQLTQYHNKMMLIEKLAAAKIFHSEEEREDLKRLFMLVLENTPIISRTGNIIINDVLPNQIDEKGL